MKQFQKIVCINFFGNEFDETYWSELDKLADKRVSVNESEVIKKHKDADALLVKLGAKVGRDLIDIFPNLKYIGMLGTGYGGIDTKHATSKEITVCNIADYATEGVAEFTFAILLEHIRSITKAKSQASNGNYSDEDFAGKEIKGKKFGIIGLGDIGTRTALLAQAFGAQVSYWSRNRKKEIEAKGILYEELDGLLFHSDIITLNLALNSETEKILDAGQIKAIKPGAIVINPSPMELLDFPSLVARLKKHDITFMLDHSDETSQEQLAELKPLKNCIIYPPIAYLTEEASALKKRIFIDNIRSFLAGIPTNKVG